MSKKNIEAAWSQAGAGGGPEINQVPAGELLGSGDAERGRIMQSLRTGEAIKVENERIGQAPSDEAIGQEAPLSPEAKEILDQVEPEAEEREKPDQEDVAAEDGWGDLFAADEDDFSFDGDDETYELGGRKVKRSTVKEWKNTYDSSQRYAEQYAEKEDQLRRAAEMFTQDPLAAAEATGSFDTLMQQLRDRGLLGSEERSTETANSSQELDALFSEGDDEGNAARRKAAASLERRFQTQEQEIQRLRTQIAQEQEQARYRQMMDQRHDRIQSAKRAAQEMIKSTPPLQGKNGKLLARVLTNRFEREIDRAPLDEGGLKDWVKDTLKDEVRSAGLYDGMPVKAEKKQPQDSPSVAQRQAPEEKQMSHQEFGNDELRQRAAMAWFAENMS